MVSRSPRADIAKYGFTQPLTFIKKPPSAITLLWMVGLFLLLGIAGGWVQDRWYAPENSFAIRRVLVDGVLRYEVIVNHHLQQATRPDFWKELSGSIPWSGGVATLALVFFGTYLGLEQWRITREEGSFEHFFRTRREINKQLCEGTSLRNLVAAAMPVDLRAPDDWFSHVMLVFAELDHLEYTFQKYRSRLMTPELAHRACEVMISRFRAESFRKLASDLVEKGRYSGEFSASVKEIESFASVPDVISYSRSQHEYLSVTYYKGKRLDDKTKQRYVFKDGGARVTFSLADIRTGGCISVRRWWQLRDAQVLLIPNTGSFRAEGLKVEIRPVAPPERNGT